MKTAELTGTEMEKEALSKDLIEISPKITKEDINQAVIDLCTSDTTIWRYLNGNAAKISFGKRMLQYFKDRVVIRERELNRLAS